MKTKTPFIPSSLHPFHLFPILFLFLILFSSSLFSQQITPSVWMSSGNVGTMSNGNQYSWSMGESFTATLPSSTLTFTQGFQQLFNVLGCTDPTAFNYNASANQDDGSCIPMLTCNITAPTTTLCAGESVTLSMNTTGGGTGLNALPANLQQGLVAYYPFNGNANDASGNGNNGTVNGATLTADRFGNANGAYSFDGVSSFIQTSLSGPLGSGARTIGYWSNANNSQANMTVLGYGNDVTKQDFHIWHNWSCEGVNVNISNAAITYSSVASGDSWDYFLVSFDPTVSSSIINVKVYKNGQLLSSACTVYGSGDLNTGSLYPVTIGKYHASNQHYFNGLMDDIVIYNRVLSPSEIQQLYTAQSYNWSNGATKSTNVVSPTSNATYSCTVTQGAQTCTASVDVTVNPAVTSTVNTSIIQGQSYTLGTQNLITAGTYTEVFTSAAGCDSTVTLNLTVEPLLTCNITAPTTTLCAGESVTLSMNTIGGGTGLNALPANLQQGLVAYYPFTGNANDASGNGNNGTVNGATLTADRFGNANGAYSFSGLSTYITTGDLLNFSQNFAISFWVKTSSSSHQVVLNTIPHSVFGYAINPYWGGANQLGYIYGNGQSAGWMIPAQSFDNPVLSLDHWVMHTITKQDNQWLFYQNDSLIYSSLASSNPVNELVQLIFGQCDPASCNEAFIGSIDDAFIHSRSLTQVEIQQLYSAQSYNWSNGGTATTNTVFPTTNTTYSCTVTQGAQTCTATLDVTVNPLLTFYADADGDGFGDVNAPQSACVQQAGTVTNSTDCNDNNASLNSVSTETCNNFDDDCDGNVDNGLIFVNYYNDLDGDGFGSGSPSNLCADPGAGYASNSTDCNDNNILVNPVAVEICGNAVDEDCSGAANACASSGTPANPIPSINIAQYGTGTQNNTVVNLATGADDIESSGTGWSKWYQFTAQSNAVRIGLRGSLLVNDDNRILLFNNTNTLGAAWIPLNEENVVAPNNLGTATDAGNEVLLYDQLTVGNVYYICVQNINNTPGSVQLSIGFLFGSQPDVGAYTNYTNVYNNSCQNFKAKFRPNGKAYTVHRRGAANEDIATVPQWSYAIPGVGSTVCQVGKIVPPNFSGANVPVYASVDVAYQLPNAFGTIETLTAQGTVIGTFYMAIEGDVVVRASDACPAYKSPITGSVATNRSVCGASRYRWEWTPQNPTAGLPIALMGAAGASRTFALSQVPGMGMNQQYGVRIGTLHLDGLTTTPYGTSSCVKTIGFAGMAVESDSQMVPSADAPLRLYPNPTINGRFTLIQHGTSEEEVKSITMTDITGKVVYKSQVVMNANSVEVVLGDLASGVYVVMAGEERLRLVVE